MRLRPAEGTHTTRFKSNESLFLLIFDPTEAAVKQLHFILSYGFLSLPLVVK